MFYNVWLNTDCKTVKYYNLDNSFSVPIAETDVCYAAKVGISVELKLTVRFENNILGGETVMILPSEIVPAFYQKCPILGVWGDNDQMVIQTVSILPNGVVASDTGFCAGKWNFIQLNYHTNI